VSTTVIETQNEVSPRIRRLLDEVRPPTPCLVLDLDVVADRYRRLREALPDADVYYAVKANPEPALVRLLVDLGSSFDGGESAGRLISRGRRAGSAGPASGRRRPRWP
jgi:ornithine decarboxylase